MNPRYGILGVSGIPGSSFAAHVDPICVSGSSLADCKGPFWEETGAKIGRVSNMLSDFADFGYSSIGSNPRKCDMYVGFAHFDISHLR